MRKILLLIILTIPWKGTSQATSGMSGLIHVPSARMLDDGQLVLGAAYIPKPYFFRYGRNENPGLNTYITYGILPFIEIMFRYTHELNTPVNFETQYFPDRMLGFRVRLLSEKNYLPAIVLGLQDPSAIFGDTCLVCTNYSATYFVGSKNFKTDFGNFDLSIGYAFDFKELKAKDYKGVFGGISFSPNFYENASFLFEHNTKGFNTGISTIVLSRFNLMLGLWNLDKPTFSFNYLF
ncbi:YjbH domain-containing protein [Flavobacteriaceae bacterium]|nr:YjbH domain-containing protein [Flavobacteriaceae bacterium]